MKGRDEELKVSGRGGGSGGERAGGKKGAEI